MKIMFQKKSLELPKPPTCKVKRQYLLHANVGGWYMKKLNEKLPPLKKRKTRKKSQEREDKIKINLQTADQNLNYWKFQIH